MLGVHPYSITKSKFMHHKDMNMFGFAVNVDYLPCSVSPKSIMNQMMSRLGKINACQTGSFTVTHALMYSLGRNFNGICWGFVSWFADSVIKLFRIKEPRYASIKWLILHF